MTLRDLLAVPFWSLALLFDRIAVSIGGKWTAEMFIEHSIKLAELQQSLKPSEEEGEE